MYEEGGSPFATPPRAHSASSIPHGSGRGGAAGAGEQAFRSPLDLALSGGIGNSNKADVTISSTNNNLPAHYGGMFNSGLHAAPPPPPPDPLSTITVPPAVPPPHSKFWDNPPPSFSSLQAAATAAAAAAAATAAPSSSRLSAPTSSAASASQFSAASAGNNSSSSVPPQCTKYSQLLAVLEEMGKDIRPSYAGSKSSSERLKRGIVHARILVREALAEADRGAAAGPQ